MSYINGKIIIQIVSFEAKDELRACLDSISWVSSDPQFEAVVVDNGSQSEVSEMVIKEYPFVYVRTNSTNLGFAAAQNQAYEVSKKLDPTHILLLNPDATISRSDIETLFSKFHTGVASQKIGIVAPKIIDAKGQIEQSIHIDLNIWMYIFKVFGIKLLRLKTQKMYEHEGFVQSVSGACMLIDTALIEDIGFFDEDYFFLTEDMDFCLRARQAGWKVLYTPDVQITHLRGRSSLKFNDADIWRRINHYTTQFTYFRKHRGWLEYALLKLGRRIEAEIRILLGIEKSFGLAMKQQLDFKIPSPFKF
ncbi:glycosyltransferase [Candidatus Dojkabacteria bacterium]|nr:glycosyltransferase [Candidatus Dojkabacteria bacterium]